MQHVMEESSHSYVSVQSSLELLKKVPADQVYSDPGTAMKNAACAEFDDVGYYRWNVLDKHG